jgi:SAM-dependent methyltransferase
MDKIFYEYYDLIFKDKEYSREIDQVCALYKKYGKRALRSALEIGCGTGGHSVALAKKGVRTMALDIDKHILKIAASKSRGLSDLPLTFKYANIATFHSEAKYDLAVSLFNVINYLPDVADMAAFFCGVHRNLRPQGLYIFDCWNGVAAIIDPPRPKTTKVTVADGTEVLTKITPENNKFAQKTILHYDIQIGTGEFKDHIKYTINQFLWTPKELKELLELCGYKVLKVTTWQDDNAPATEKDWKILFICQK